MPTTIEQFAIATVALAIALIVVVVVQRRWPRDESVDSLVLLYRRWAARGRVGFGTQPATRERPTPVVERRQRPAGPRASKEELLRAASERRAAERASSAAEDVASRPPTRKAKPPAKKTPAAKKKSPPRKAVRKPPARRPKAAGRDVSVPPEPETEKVPDVELIEPAHESGPLREAEAMTDEQPDQIETPATDEQAAPSEVEQEGRRRWLRRRRRREGDEEPLAEPAAPGMAEAPAPPPQDERPVLPPEPAERAREPAPQPAPVTPAAAEITGEHVPLATAQEHERTGEPKILLRQRFRRGRRRTRERLGAEMREAFTGGATPEAFDRLEDALVAADVGVATTAALVDGLRDRIGLADTTLANALRDVMVAQLQDADRRLRLVKGKVSVWVVVGVNGTGKTTTIAKLAARARDLGIPVSLAAADTFRAAAVEQLSEWGRRLGVEVIKQGQGADPGAVVFDAIANAKASGKRLLIVDTAGRLHTRKPLMEELQKVVRVIERDDDAVIAEALLVIDATTGQNGIAQAKAFKDAVAVTGLALAKLDGSAKGGITFAVERELGVPVKAVGVGESEKDLVPFDPTTFVEALVGED